MKIIAIQTWARATSLLVTLVACSVASPAEAQIDPAARALVQSVSEKLGAARTIRLTARHTPDPALGVGSKLEQGPLQITVKRPNLFFAVQQAGHETREIAFDGRPPTPAKFKC